MAGCPPTTSHSLGNQYEHFTRGSNIPTPRPPWKDPKIRIQNTKFLQIGLTAIVIQSLFI